MKLFVLRIIFECVLLVTNWVFHSATKMGSKANLNSIR